MIAFPTIAERQSTDSFMLIQLFRCVTTVIAALIVSNFEFNTSVIAQNPPTNADSEEYREAYGLLFDSHARALKAKTLLTQNGNRELNTLSENELKLLCRVENELGDSGSQFAVVKLLWNRTSSEIETLPWVQNAISNILLERGGPAEVLSFVQNAINEKQANLADLLIFKAQAILASQENDGVANRESAAIELLLRASTLMTSEGPLRSAMYGESLDFIDQVYSFKSGLSTADRKALKERIVAKREELKN